VVKGLNEEGLIEPGCHTKLLSPHILSNRSSSRGAKGAVAIQRNKLQPCGSWIATGFALAMTKTVSVYDAWYHFFAFAFR
jgi:hypothetical protein